MILTLIAAIDSKNGIGKANDIPWKLKEDMFHFRRTTTGHTVIMGYQTFVSMGSRPLANRRNIVLSRDPSKRSMLMCPGPVIEWAASIDEALSMCANTEKVFVIGGAQVYEASIALADNLVITHISRDFDCDRFFPQISEFIWTAHLSMELKSDELGCTYTINTYVRRSISDPTIIVEEARSQQCAPPHIRERRAIHRIKGRL